MLIITRKADQCGGMGSSVAIGDINVTLVHSSRFGAAFRVKYPSGDVREHVVRFEQPLSLAEGVKLIPKRNNRGRIDQYIRLLIDAPKEMHIRRDNMVHSRAAA